MKIRINDIGKLKDNCSLHKKSDFKNLHVDQYEVYALVYSGFELWVIAEIYYGHTRSIKVNEFTIVDNSIPAGWVVVKEARYKTALEDPSKLMVVGYPELRDIEYIFSDFVDDPILPSVLWKYKLEIDKRDNKFDILNHDFGDTSCFPEQFWQHRIQLERQKQAKEDDLKGL